MTPFIWGFMIGIEASDRYKNLSNSVAFRTASVIAEINAELLRMEEDCKLAHALITLVDSENMPRRFIAGADAIEGAEHKVALLQRQINAHRELSCSLAFDKINQ